MNPSEIIAAIKEFFLEIIGYLIPGIVALSIALLCVPNFTIGVVLDKIHVGSTIIYLIISYCLGYIVYGLALMRDKLMDKINWIESPKKISSKLEESLQYKMAVETLKSLWIQSSLLSRSEEGIKKFDFRETRDAVMAYIPEADNKIYTFMFRSELCNHLNVLLILISSLGLLSLTLNAIFPCIYFLQISKGYVLFYVIAVFMAWILHKTRMRFLSIAYNIPFTIFIAKYYQIPKS